MEGNWKGSEEDFNFDFEADFEFDFEVDSFFLNSLFCKTV